MSVPGDPGRDKTPCHSFRLPPLQSHRPYQPLECAMSDLKPIQFEFDGPADTGLVVRPTIDPSGLAAGTPVPDR